MQSGVIISIATVSQDDGNISYWYPKLTLFLRIEGETIKTDGYNINHHIVDLSRTLSRQQVLGPPMGPMLTAPYSAAGGLTLCQWTLEQLLWVYNISTDVFHN